MIRITESENFLRIYESEVDENTLIKIEGIGDCIDYTKIYDYEIVWYVKGNVIDIKRGIACNFSYLKQEIQSLEYKDADTVTLDMIMENIR